MERNPGPSTGTADLLLLGDPGLRQISDPVEDIADPAVAQILDRLRSCLSAFRAEHGFGRAVSAPQIGVPLRIIAVDVDGGPPVLINPEVTWRSADTFTLWDDCMSIPCLLVRVRRYASISVSYTDEQGAEQVWEKLDRAHAELMQHEIDHLDGVLALDRALDRDAIISRGAYQARPDLFLRLVDGP